MLLHHQKERILDIYRTLRGRYLPLAEKKHTFIYSATRWDGGMKWQRQEGGMIKENIEYSRSGI